VRHARERVFDDVQRERLLGQRLEAARLAQPRGGEGGVVVDELLELRQRDLGVFLLQLVAAPSRGA